MKTIFFAKLKIEKWSGNILPESNSWYFLALLVPLEDLRLDVMTEFCGSRVESQFDGRLTVPKTKFPNRKIGKSKIMQFLFTSKWKQDTQPFKNKCSDWLLINFALPAALSCTTNFLSKLRRHERHERRLESTAVGFVDKEDYQNGYLG